MTCDPRAAELLPFYWNGSLQPAERAEVEQHLADCVACRASLAEIRATARVFAAHIPTEALVDLAWDRLPAGDERDLYERHLAECPPCTAELELLRASRALEGADGIALFRAPSALKPESVTAAVAPRRGRSWRSAALAAGLGGVIAATGWVSTARENDRLLTQMAESAIQRGQIEAARPTRATAPSAPSELAPSSPSSQTGLTPAPAAGGAPVSETAKPAAPIASVFASRLLLQSSSDTLRGGDDQAVCRGVSCALEIPTADLAVAPSYALEIAAWHGAQRWSTDSRG